jgi:hypothetical protein
MRDVIQRWYEWLKQATSVEQQELAHVYSDGRQLWTTDGYRLHARQVELEKQGIVVLNEEGMFGVNENSQLPDFAASLPQAEPVASVVVERDVLLQAVTGQDRYVRLNIFAANQGVELSSAGAYALVMPVIGLEAEDFWRPNTSKP